MSIRKKLYWGFGSILIIVALLFVVSTMAIWHEGSAKQLADKVVELVQAKAQISHQAEV